MHDTLLTDNNEAPTIRGRLAIVPDQTGKSYSITKVDRGLRVGGFEPGVYSVSYGSEGDKQWIFSGLAATSDQALRRAKRKQERKNSKH